MDTALAILGAVALTVLIIWWLKLLRGKNISQDVTTVVTEVKDTVDVAKQDVANIEGK